MITVDELKKYHGLSLSRDENFISVSPHKGLKAFISCYTITFPKMMPDDYTIIPSASSTLILSLQNNRINNILNGVCTKPKVAGNYANKMDLMVLIEFRPGCLYPFVHMEQSQLMDQYVALYDINKELTYVLEENLVHAKSINELISKLDEILISVLYDYSCNKKNKLWGNSRFNAMMNHIILQKGNIRMKELSEEFFYSEKQIRRLFYTYVGMNPKMFSRILRVNHAIYIMKNNTPYLADAAISAGYFDQSHFIHDFESICSVSPKDYQKKMSVFYNEKYKFML